MRKFGVLILFVGILVFSTACVEISVLGDGRIEYQEKSEELFDPVDIFVLDNFNGSVEIQPSEDGKIKVQWVKYIKGDSEERLREVAELIKVEITEKSDLLQIKTEQPRPRPIGVNSMWMGFRIYLPVEIKANIRTANGSITVYGLRNNLSLRTSNGNITINDHIGNIIGDTSNGSIRVNEFLGEIDLDSSNGSVLLYDMEGKIKADTSNGKIIVESDKVVERAELGTSNSSIEFKARMQREGYYRFNTSNGSISLWLDTQMGYYLDAKTSNGKINFSFPTQFHGSYSKKEILGELFGGGTKVLLRTSNGNINLQELGVK